MKVLLIRPPQNRFRPTFLGSQAALNLAYLSSALKEEGIECDILDFESVVFSEERLARQIEQWQPDLIGLTAFTCTVANAAHIGKFLKERFPKIVTVLGGVHVSTLPRESVLDFPFIDYIYVGEGEAHFPEFCKMVEEGEADKSKEMNIPGLCYIKTDGNVVINSPQLVVDISDLAFPDRSYEFAAGTGVKGLKTQSELNYSQVLTSRGCPFKCTFCAVEVIHSGKTDPALNLRGEVVYQGNKNLSVRQRTPDNVIDELKMLREEHGVEHIDIIDSTFTVNRKRAIPIVEAIGKLGMTFNCNSIINTVSYELLHCMVENGCQKISYGIETGSPKILKLINKKIDADGIRKRIEATRRANIPVMECSYIIGVHPDETEEDMRATERFMDELDADVSVLSVGIPFPGTAMYKQFKEANLYNMDNNWDLFSFYGARPLVKTKTVSNERLLFLQKQIMRNYYFRPKRIVRHVRKLRSIGQLAASVKAATSLVVQRAA